MARLQAVRGGLLTKMILCDVGVGIGDVMEGMGSLWESLLAITGPSSIFIPAEVSVGLDL